MPFTPNDNNFTTMSDLDKPSSFINASIITFVYFFAFLPLVMHSRNIIINDQTQSLIMYVWIDTQNWLSIIVTSSQLSARYWKATKASFAFDFTYLCIKSATTEPIVSNQCFLANKRTPKKQKKGVKTSYSNKGYPCWKRWNIVANYCHFLPLSPFNPTCTCSIIVQWLLLMYIVAFFKCWHLLLTN
jgi:hypothetical protein